MSEGQLFPGRVVHCYADSRKDRLYLLGRLDDGRSFAAAEGKWRPSLHIYEDDKEQAARVLSSLKFQTYPPDLEDFEGRRKLRLLKFFHYRDYTTAGKLLEQGGISSPDGDLKPQDAFLIQRHIQGPVELEGETRQGKLVDLVFPEPEIRSIAASKASLRIASVDIETDTRDGTILAAGMSVAQDHSCEISFGIVRVLSGTVGQRPPKEGVIFHPTEASLLIAFLEDIRKADPDVITGWNFLDFDFPHLAERCGILHIPFTMGRSEEEAKYFPPSVNERGGGLNRGRFSAAAHVQGRQVLDALRIFRSGPRAGNNRGDISNYSLEAVAMSVLGEGKLVASSGKEKINELKELYQRDPLRFGEYCLRDAELVLRIFQKTGLFRLTMERASLTGVSLDKAWTSVISFERIYGMELSRRLIAPVSIDPRRSVSGAAGGTVLDPLSGLFPNVAVFDFRSLYPTIMLTFNIDPLAYGRAWTDTKNIITAPNGAVFSREKGVLPEIIEGFFAARRIALEAGDEEASYVYKILMNSFYGVLGTSTCRYARSELAGAITSFARKWLLFSRDWFIQAGYKVLYGDTDSLFVETGLEDKANYEGFLEWGKACSRKLNASLGTLVRDEYLLESCMELRFEKVYRRFMIPPLRNTSESRGRAKGYGGYLLHPDGSLQVEVKGMEAVRSDYTALARRIQVELLELVFSGGSEDAFVNQVRQILNHMRRGDLDSELVYRKRLSRAPETYTASTPPQVKAARALGWKDRRGTVEYVWTINGPEPLANEDGQYLRHNPLDYDHYAESQVLPTARSIAAAAGWNIDLLPSPGKAYFRDGQLELGLF